MPNLAQGSVSTSDMVIDLQQRIPMGLADAYCMLRLNQAYQWIEQQGAFTWNIVRSSFVLVAPNAIVDMPDDLDIGKPWSIYPIETGGTEALYAEVPYVPMDEIANQQIFHLDIIPGVFSCHTAVVQGTDYRFRFAPLDAVMPGPNPANDITFIVYYHKINEAITTPLSRSGGVYFPTPPAFDQAIVDLAEAEIRRLYKLSGYAEAISKAQASARLELDKYRSPKRDLAGVMEQSTEVQEKQLNGAQVG